LTIYIRKGGVSGGSKKRRRRAKARQAVGSIPIVGVKGKATLSLHYSIARRADRGGEERQRRGNILKRSARRRGCSLRSTRPSKNLKVEEERRTTAAGTVN